jgi:hypothetical protein
MNNTVFKVEEINGQVDIYFADKKERTEKLCWSLKKIASTRSTGSGCSLQWRNGTECILQRDGQKKGTVAKVYLNRELLKQKNPEKEFKIDLPVYTNYFIQLNKMLTELVPKLMQIQSLTELGPLEDDNITNLRQFIVNSLRENEIADTDEITITNTNTFLSQIMQQLQACLQHLTTIKKSIRKSMPFIRQLSTVYTDSDANKLRHLNDYIKRLNTFMQIIEPLCKYAEVNESLYQNISVDMKNVDVSYNPLTVYNFTAEELKKKCDNSGTNSLFNK